MKRAAILSFGFTLVEMAITLAIVALLLGGGLTVLGTQIEVRKFRDTKKQLDEAKEALLGFAVANGRLPCPASAASNGVESPVGGGACSNPHDGFLPAVTLGLSGIDRSGYLLDGWATPANRIRYAVTSGNSSAATTPNGIRTTTLAVFGAATNTAHLHVCASAAGIATNNCGAATGNTLTGNAIAVVFSAGKNAATGGIGVDEAANLNNDQVFISHAPVEAGGNGGEFDDMVNWIPIGIFFNRMLQAYRLP